MWVRVYIQCVLEIAIQSNADHNISRFFVRIHLVYIYRGTEGLKDDRKCTGGNWVRLGFPSSANPRGRRWFIAAWIYIAIKWKLRRILRKRYRCSGRNDHCPRRWPAWKVSRVENLETGRGNGYSSSGGCGGGPLPPVTGRLLFLPSPSSFPPPPPPALSRSFLRNHIHKSRRRRS